MTVTGNGFSLDGFTFSNYNLLIHASLWRDALYFTLYYTLVTVVVELILGHLHRARARAPGGGPRLDDGAAAHSLVDDHRHQRRAVGLHLQRHLRRRRLHTERPRPGQPGHPRHPDPRHHRPDDRRHLEDHALRGHHRAGRPGHAARGRLRGGRDGRRVRLVHVLARHPAAAAADDRARGHVPDAAGLRPVRPALRDDRRRSRAPRPSRWPSWPTTRCSRTSRSGPAPPSRQAPRCWCCSAAWPPSGCSGLRSDRKAADMRNRKRVGWHRYVNGVTICHAGHRALHPHSAVLADRHQLQEPELDR